MRKTMSEEERLSRLVEAFKADSGAYADMGTPSDTDGKRQLLRALMNVRPPRRMDEAVLRLQDEYLAERLQARGVVTLADIPTLKEQGRRAEGAEVLSLWQGDITRLQADAIVNAANSQMLGCFVPLHACIDNCIHTYAGVQLRAECARQMEALRAKYGPDYEQPTAVPLLTKGYSLPAKHVIHIVGPIVMGPLTPVHERELAACYRNTLDLCRKEGLRSVAFCCISTGVFRFPAPRASEIAVKTVQSWLRENPGRMDRVIFNVFTDTDRRLYERQF